VSGRHTLGLVSSIVALLAIIALAIWNPLAAFVGICGASVASVVTWLLSSKRNEKTESGSNKNDLMHVPAWTADEKRARANVVSPTALLDATMNSMREGVLIVDHEMRIIASNSAARDTFQAVDGKLETLRLSDLTRNPSIHDAFRAAVDEGEAAEVKVEMRRGDRRIFDLRVAPLRLESAGRSRGAIGVFFDITQLERLELVRQEFLSNVSHELRTPLTAIIAFVETLEEGAIEDSEHNRRFLTVIRKNAERMHNLIDDILELSSIEAGIVTVEPRPVRLAAVVEDTTTALAARAETRKVTLRNEIAQDVQVYADARRLEQMLTNLIDNAVKFNREGGEVTVRYKTTDTRDCISVIDTGDGVSGEHIERIFERFYRIDRARSRDMGGTGLGLAIVKHLARAHGGEATVQSTPGEGSTFTIELPRQVMGDE
jgi:two-component system phosphate regulon sensor histidine kinase PhoR